MQQIKFEELSQELRDIAIKLWEMRKELKEANYESFATQVLGEVEWLISDLADEFKKPF